MTFQMELFRPCEYCGDTMNHCGDRGNGKQRHFCDRECSRKMYVLKKRIDNYMQQMVLRKNKFTRQGEFTERNYKFIQMASNYIDSNLPAIRIAFHINAALEGRNASPVEAVFQNIIENKGKVKCLI